MSKTSRRNPHRRARIPKRRALSFRGASDVRGYGGDASVSPLLLAGGGLALLALLFSNKKTIIDAGTSIVTTGTNIVSAAKAAIGAAFDYSKAAAFKASLPSNIARWSTQLLVASQRYGIDPWILAGIMYVETHGGDAPGYVPKGDPAGTGDFIPRYDSSKPKPANATSKWVASRWGKYANTATGLPPDGKGWGRGLMQIDYGAHNAWVLSNPWWDPQVNINKVAELLAANKDYLSKSVAPGTTVTVEAWRLTRGMGYGIEPWVTKYGVSAKPGPAVLNSKGEVIGYKVPDPRPITGLKLIEAMAVSHNTGVGGVLQALAMGLPPEAASTGQTYWTKLTARVGDWLPKFG